MQITLTPKESTLAAQGQPFEVWREMEVLGQMEAEERSKAMSKVSPTAHPAHRPVAISLRPRL